MKKNVVILCSVFAVLLALTGMNAYAEEAVQAEDAAHTEDTAHPTGWYKDASGRWYYYDSEDVMHQGWIQLSDQWYYLGQDGVMKTGWQQIGGKWYYLQPGGAMAQGWIRLNGKWYYLEESGAMKTGWKYVDGAWYYLQSDGAMAQGWIKPNGKWYYLGTGGAMRTGWQYIGRYWYYLEPDGHMITGWKKLNDVWYYMNASGQMLTGVHDINGRRYYFNQGGAMSEVELSNLLENALQPAGTTLYVWGGGWNVPDNGAGETAVNVGLWPEWRTYFLNNKKNYSYRAGRTAWENGKRESRFWGLDCSGYLGWLVYNSVQHGKDSRGYVTDAAQLARSLAGYGFGTATACTPRSTYYPGDIVSISGHCFLSLGQCKDGSVLLLHSTPNGGVQMSGTVNGSGSSQASRLAQTFMKEHYPEWWDCFGKEGRQAVSASVYLNGTKLTWKNAGAVYDPEGVQRMSADQVVDYMEKNLMK